MKDKLIKLSPLLFTLFGLLFLGGISLKQFLIPRPVSFLVLQLLTVISYVLYMSFESKISVNEMNKSASLDYDRNTMELAAVIKISLLASCLGLANQLIRPENYLWVASCGFCLMLLGFFIRGKSIKDLGPNYGHRIREIGAHLHDRGMYSVIRHGAYSGAFFIHAGVTLIFLNRFSLLFLVLWLGVVVLRIQLEEKLLMQDNRYKEYAKQTRFKMIPFIW